MRTVDWVSLAFVGLVDPAGEVGCVYVARVVPLVGLVASEVLDLVGTCVVMADDVGCVDGAGLMPVVV